MNDINDTIQEPLEEAGKSKINSKVAIFAAITATFMALCNVKDGGKHCAGHVPGTGACY